MTRSPEVRFGLCFAGGVVLLLWLTREPAPFPVIDELRRSLVGIQTALAAGMLRGVGQDVLGSGTILAGPRFRCEVGSGCSGLQALVLAWAAVLAFPAPFRARFLGWLLLTSAVIGVNLLRISGLWLAGAYRPDLFDLGHVYLGQVLIILATAALWWSWASRQPVVPRSTGDVAA